MPNFNVGTGVRDAMDRRGDQPRGNEMYESDLETGETLYSVTLGGQGLYRWTPQDNVKVASFGGTGPLPGQLWKHLAGLVVPSAIDDVQLITAGFSTARDWKRNSFDHLVVHDLEGHRQGAIAWWNTGVAGAHIIICRDGTAVLTCPLDLVVWHAGTNAKTGLVSRGVDFSRYNINPDSVGVEMEGFGFRKDADGQFYTSQQFDTLVRFGRWYRDALGWAGDEAHTWRHSEISNQRGDPGPHLDVGEFVRQVAAG
jgi:N-acetyl-anhydromuramyl-L-alanine amidase AmpD